jgi:hypothetical protein
MGKQESKPDGDRITDYDPRQSILPTHPGLPAVAVSRMGAHLLGEESPNDTEGENAGNHELIQEPGHLTTGKHVHEHQADRQGDR